MQKSKPNAKTVGLMLKILGIKFYRTVLTLWTFLFLQCVVLFCLTGKHAWPFTKNLHLFFLMSIDSS